MSGLYVPGEEGWPWPDFPQFDPDDHRNHGVVAVRWRALNGYRVVRVHLAVDPDWRIEGHGYGVGALLSAVMARARDGIRRNTDPWQE